MSNNNPSPRALFNAAHSSLSIAERTLQAALGELIGASSLLRTSPNDDTQAQWVAALEDFRKAAKAHDDAIGKAMVGWGGLKISREEGEGET